MKPEIKAYLSIDLDYWSTFGNCRSAGQFFRKVLFLNVPILVVIEHEELVPNINKSGAQILYNVDYHSDICSDEQIKASEQPEDGTWVNFISWKKTGEYHWIYPNKKCYDLNEGLCHAEEQYDPFTKDLSGWKKTEHTLRLSTIDWRKICAVGVCLSPGYISYPTVRTVLPKLKVPRQKVEEILAEPVSWNPKNRMRGTLSKITEIKKCA